jgi:hypothetical protein
MLAERFKCRACCTLDQINMKAGPHGGDLSGRRPMRRHGALANALERRVIKAFALPNGAEPERQHSNFALLLRGKPISGRASIEGRQFVKCRQAIDERPCGGRWRNVSHCASLRTLMMV